MKYAITLLTSLILASLASFGSDAGQPLSIPAQTMPTNGQAVKPPSNSITVHLEDQVSRMAGGIGASWHCVSHEFTFTNLMKRSQLKARGSAWGGNPPAEQEDRWKRMEELATWLGMDFMRVELEQNSYEPNRGAFDWDSEEMKALYRILDWCEKDGVDVFLTQMYANVDWNAYDGVSRVQSAPKDMNAFAVGLATLVEHLVKVKHYTCIKWICINNEPTGLWAWWLGPDAKLMSITPGLKAVRAELDKRGIIIPLSAPDHNSLKALKNGFDFDGYVGAYDCHDYGEPDAHAMKQWADYARSKGKPFMITEMGDGRFNRGQDASGPNSYNHAMSMANKIVLGLNVGVGAFNRWSFVNRGDIDGQWQLIRTWDRTAKKYLDKEKIEPEPISYYAYGIITRFTAKHSSVLKTENSSPEVVSTALRSPDGNLTFIVVNNSSNEQSMSISLSGVAQSPKLYCYQVAEPAVNRPDFQMDPIKQIEISANKPQFNDQLPKSSITVYSTYHLTHADNGITE